MIIYIMRQGWIDDYFSQIRLGPCGVRDRNRKWKDEDQGKAKKVGGDAQIRARLWSGTAVGCGDKCNRPCIEAWVWDRVRRSN